ncbi:MAG: thermonuclease family protein [Planctomycetota bacterium]
MQRHKAAGLVLALLIVLVIALLDRSAGLFPVHDDFHKYHDQSFEVLRVIDGDTLELKAPDGDQKTTRVRLWGVNTPEMHADNPDTPPEPWAEEATAFVRDAVAGQLVVLRLQDHRLRGRFGRLLAYVVLADGRVLNAALIENGLSKHDGRWGHDQGGYFEALEKNARERRVGLWGP